MAEFRRAFSAIDDDTPAPPCANRCASCSPPSSILEQL
jgi:hypothetical protein